MNVIERLLFGSIGAAVAGLVLGYLGSDASVLAPLPALAGLLWLAGRWRGWRWIASPAMVTLTLLAALGMTRGASPILLFVGSVASLVAWDLDQFTRRLQRAACAFDAAALAAEHLRRLAAVSALGLLLGLIALVVHLRLDIGWALAIGLVAAVSLSRAIRFLRRESI